MKKQMNKLMNKVDMFGMPISLNFSRDTKYRSKFGLLMSIGCIGALIAYLFAGPLAPIFGLKKRDFTYIATTVNEE